MDKNKRMTIEIPAELVEDTIKPLRHMKRFSGLSDGGIIEAVLSAGVNKARPIMEDCTAEVETCYSVLLAVCTAIQSGATVDALMPALWDAANRLHDTAMYMGESQQ